MLGDKAVLISDVMAGQQCMQFKYHMYGEDTGSLSIHRRGIPLWKASGNHGDQWLQGQVDLDCSIPEYHVRFIFYIFLVIYYTYFYFKFIFINTMKSCAKQTDFEAKRRKTRASKTRLVSVLLLIG